MAENMAEYVDLLEAKKILEGHEDARPSGPPDRKEIVHRDIKPANIFLREPVSPYESYPRPVFGDLDGLLRLNDKNRLKKKGRLRSETYTAPVSTRRDRTHLPRYFNADYSIRKTVTGPTGNSKTNISLAKQTYGA
jgi:serine/threonine protein kinase